MNICFLFFIHHGASTAERSSQRIIYGLPQEKLHKFRTKEAYPLEEVTTFLPSESNRGR